MLGRPRKAIDNEPERWLDGINPRVLRHVFFQDVVLNRAAKLLQIDALLFCGSKVEAVQNDGRSVDRHRCGDFVELNSVARRFRVGEAGERNAALSYLTFRSG